jgi:hypothetical protein
VVSILYPKSNWGRISVRPPVNMRIVLFCRVDSVESGDLYSALSIKLEEEDSHTPGTDLFLPVVTGRTFASRTTHPVFRLQGSKFRVDRLII